MQYTRKQIISYLRSHHTASIPELSRVLNLTVGNIRHHIKALEDQQIIKQVGNLPIKGKGRPIKIYTLTKEAEDHNLDGLADVLMKILVSKSMGDSKENLENVAKEMTKKFQGGTTSIQRLNQVIQWLDERNYQAHWEASPTGPRVIIDHCPYSAIQPDNPEICQIDNAMISKLLGIPVRQTCKRRFDHQEPKQCIFALQTEKVKS